MTKLKGLVEKVKTHESRWLENFKNKNLDGCISELCEKLGTLRKLKTVFQKRSDEKMANRLLVEELATEADISFLKFDRAFVRRKFGRAWDEVNTSFNNYRVAVQVADQIGFESKENMAKLEKCKEIIEKFPQQWFTSPEILIKRVECNICGKELQECSHLPGKVYCGELCHGIVKDMEGLAAALTTNPVDPRCRVVPTGWDYDTGWFIGSFRKQNIKQIIKQMKKTQNIIARSFGSLGNI